MHRLLCVQPFQKHSDRKENGVLLEAGAIAWLGRCPRCGPMFHDHAAKEFAMQSTRHQDSATKALGAFKKTKFLLSEAILDDNLEMQTTEPPNNTINIADPRNDAWEKCRPPHFT